MAQTKEQILRILEKAREHAAVLASNGFEAKGEWVVWKSKGGETPIQWFKTAAIAQQIADAWNTTLNQYESVVDIKKLESDLAEQYKTADGAEDVVPIEKP